MNLSSVKQRVAGITESATAQVDQWRGRSRVVDVGFRVVNRERLIATSVTSAFVAFRLFVFLIPYLYVVVAALGFYSQERSGGTEEVMREIGFGGAIARNLGQALETSDRGRWVAIIAGSGALLWASLGVSKSLYAVYLVAWHLPRSRMRTGVLAVIGPVVFVTAFLLVNAGAAALRDRTPGPGLVATFLAIVVYAGLWFAQSVFLPREPGSPWTALLPGALLAAVGLQALHFAVVFYFVPRVGRASEVYGALGISLVTLAWLFLIARLMVASAELNASLWEQRWGRLPADDRARIDPDGRVSLPRPVRGELGLLTGDQFDVERDGESIRLVPHRDEPTVSPPESSPSAPRTPPR